MLTLADASFYNLPHEEFIRRSLVISCQHLSARFNSLSFNGYLLCLLTRPSAFASGAIKSCIWLCAGRGRCVSKPRFPAWNTGENWGWDRGHEAHAAVRECGRKRR